jgi:Beta protein
MTIGPYVPLLKGKAGEFDAIRQMPLSKKATFTPLLDIPQMAVESSEEAPISLDDYLERKVSRIAKAWDCEDRPVFVDLFDTDPSARTTGGTHPLVRVFELLRDAGVQAIPTTGLDRDTAYQDAVRRIVDIDKRGVCLRMLRDDLASGFALSGTLNDLLGRFNLERDQADLLLDFRKIDAAAADDVAATAAKTINSLAGIADWRSLIFSASGMPQSLTEDVKTGKVGDIERIEYRIWTDLVARRLKRTPLFGDYGVVHPELTYIDPKMVNASAAIKYTLSNRWLILRGRSLRQSTEGFGQFYGLSRSLAKMKEFMGSDYSWGDEEIQKKADRKGTTGNLTTWIAVATNHHLTFVASQVAAVV